MPMALCNFVPSAPITNGKSMYFTFLVWSPNKMTGKSLIILEPSLTYPSTKDRP